MLFCEYPFERPQDAKDNRRYALVLDRVMNVNYKIPDGELNHTSTVSALSRDSCELNPFQSFK